jgi:hypothetical protein
MEVWFNSPLFTEEEKSPVEPITQQGLHMKEGGNLVQNPAS